jgi:peptidoglycan/LPS O-acetylase OafA/YrhL
VHGPAMSGWLLVALCGMTGAYCLVRMRSCSGEARRTAGGEALMGFGMAAMAVPAAVLAPPAWGWAVFAAVFAAAALRALWPARRSGHHLHHLVGSLAMVYMAVAMATSPGGGHAGHAAAGVPLLTGGLLVYYTVYVLRSGVRLASPVASPAGGAAAALGRDTRSELAPACRLSMGIGMLAMLLAL